MPLIQLVIVLVVFGVLLWVINTYIPMDATIKRILNGLVILIVILFVLSAFGVLDSISHVKVGAGVPLNTLPLSLCLQSGSGALPAYPS